ncbi:PP2C family protein-serine/threonine phosphatase [Nonomuraea longicatena]|uniref:PPM-type phosphatase domain-containing protein n=1 Tax=Nonomuraea longicatena TaxID=83682 RepID=A0ABN1NV37_9ACTN
MPVTVNAAARTHTGLIRGSNQDAFLVGHQLVAVADGLGGHNGGEVASSSVIEVLRTHDRRVETIQLIDTLGRAVYAANQVLHHTTRTRPELAGMGTTLVAMLWSGSTAVLANIGDSRAYRLHGPAPLAQLTEDHTCENLLSDADDVPGFAERISRFLDGRPDGRSPDLVTMELHAGDRFLLCSDGLSSAVPNGLINECLRSLPDREKVADRLIGLALEHGGPDNVTVIVIDVWDDTAPRPVAP